MNTSLYRNDKAPFTGGRKQSGFVLVFALFLLAVMTLIGVSSMNSANMELRGSANSRQHHVAYNAVHSLLEYVISSEAVTTGGDPINFQNNDDALVQPVTYTVSGSNTLNAQVRFAGCTKGIGMSLQEGQGFVDNYYGVTGSGGNSTGTATSTQGMGVKYVGASC